MSKRRAKRWVIYHFLIPTYVIYDNLICSEQNSSYFSNNHDLKVRCCCKKFNVNIGGKDQKCSDICDKTKYSDVFISFPCKETKKLLHQEYLCQLGMNDASKYDVVCGSHFLDDDFEFVGRRYQLKKKQLVLEITRCKLVLIQEIYLLSHVGL